MWDSSLLPDHPVNISISINPAHVVWGSSVNLTCSSDANPPTDTYTWYSRTDSNGSSALQVGSGRVLSISSMEVSHSGLYLCQARNQLGKKNSSEVLLAIVEEEQGLWLLQFAKIISVKWLDDPGVWPPQATIHLWFWLELDSPSSRLLLSPSCCSGESVMDEDTAFFSTQTSHLL